MPFPIAKTLFSLLAATILACSASPNTARAQTYPIDCAILLCLSGGWPASVPCSRARAEFVRRITPWPIEPPLQIWRCPMGASHQLDPQPPETTRLFDATFKSSEERPRQSFGAIKTNLNLEVENSARFPDGSSDVMVSVGHALRLVQHRADIDISGPEFNFVRSIRVFDVRYAWQRESPRDGGCYRSAAIFLGTYGTQGNFSWHSSSASALPAAHVGLNGWGDRCPSIYHRSVFVDWRDYEGNYGFEQVNY